MLAVECGQDPLIPCGGAEQVMVMLACSLCRLRMERREPEARLVQKLLLDLYAAASQLWDVRLEPPKGGAPGCLVPLRQGCEALVEDGVLTAKCGGEAWYVCRLGLPGR